MVYNSQPQHLIGLDHKRFFLTRAPCPLQGRCSCPLHQFILDPVSQHSLYLG